jgi:UDP-glucose 4-epimerase
MTSKILVTGGCGYIGSHVVKKLIKLGYEVIVLDDLSTGSLKFLSKKAKFKKGDFADQTILNQIMSNGQIDTIMHFAAYISVSESIENPEKYILNNYEKSSILWSVAVKNKVPHIIFSSTAAAYGEVGKT